LACFKAKAVPFDLSQNANAQLSVGGLVILNTPKGSGSTTVSAPQNLSYSLTDQQRKLIPGSTSVIPAPKITGTVDSWSISVTPELPSWMVFNKQTGEITCTPPTPPPSSTIDYTVTVTARNAGGSKSETFVLQLLGSGQPVWQILGGVAGGNTYAGTNSMKFDPTCNCLYIAGTTTGNLDGQIIPSTSGNASGFVSRYDLNGNRIWTKVFGVSGAAATSVAGLVTDSSGNIYVTGSKGVGNFNGCNGTASITGYIIKYSSSGNYQWTTCTGAGIRHFYIGLAIDTNGDVIAGGTSIDNGLDGMNHNSSTDAAGIIQKFNPNTGSRLSGVIIPGNSSPARGTEGYGLSSDSSGNFYLAVATRSGSYCGDGSTSYRPSVFRYNASLGYINCHIISSSTNSVFAFGVTATPGGESYLSGYIENSISFDGYPNIGPTDGYFSRFNSSGTKQWTRRLGVAGAVTAINSVFYDTTEDKVYITGLTGGNLEGNTVTGTRDMFVAKYDSSGNRIWLKMQGIINDSTTLHHSSGTSIAFDNNRTLYSFGDTNGTVGTLTNPAGGTNRSFFLVRNVQ
jgi:hypothetical protein